MPAGHARVMRRRTLAVRIVRRAIRDIKSLFGVESYLEGEDRRVLENVIFPYFLRERSYGSVLFVGCEWYTRGYNAQFEACKNFCTLDVDPAARKHGARRHITDDLQNLRRYFSPGAIDLILCNGVFGWGLDAKPDVECAFASCIECLAENGVLIVGWDDIPERRPFPLRECASLNALQPFPFPPLGTSEYLTATAYRHTLTFFVKHSSRGNECRSEPRTRQAVDHER